MTQLPPKKEKFKYISETEDIVGEQKKKKKKQREKNMSGKLSKHTLLPPSVQSTTFHQ